MNTFRWVIQMLVILVPFVAVSASQKCQVSSDIVVYDAATLKVKSQVHGASEWFAVTSEPHEDPKSIKILAGNDVVGEGTLWTGTLLGTPEGDVIQAHASFQLAGAAGTAVLVMSVNAPMAKTIVTLDRETENEMYLIPVDLKCVTY